MTMRFTCKKCGKVNVVQVGDSQERPVLFSAADQAADRRINVRCESCQTEATVRVSS